MNRKIILGVLCLMMISVLGGCSKSKETGAEEVANVVTEMESTEATKEEEYTKNEKITKNQEITPDEGADIETQESETALVDFETQKTDATETCNSDAFTVNYDTAKFRCYKIGDTGITECDYIPNDSNHLLISVRLASAADVMANLDDEFMGLTDAESISCGRYEGLTRTQVRTDMDGVGTKLIALPIDETHTLYIELAYYFQSKVDESLFQTDVDTLFDGLEIK